MVLKTDLKIPVEMWALDGEHGLV